MTLLVYALACGGIWYVLGASRITQGARDLLHKAQPTKILVDMLECAGCCGTWLGIAAWLLGLGPRLEVVPDWIVVPAFTCMSNLLLAQWAGLNRER